MNGILRLDLGRGMLRLELEALTLTLSDTQLAVSCQQLSLARHTKLILEQHGR